MRYRYFVDCVARRGETAVFAGLVFANFSYATAVLGTSPPPPTPPPNVPLLNNCTVNLGLKQRLNLRVVLPIRTLHSGHQINFTASLSTLFN